MRSLSDMISEERARYEKLPLFAGVSGEFEESASDEEFWSALSNQIVMGLDEFARQQARAVACQANLRQWGVLFSRSVNRNVNWAAMENPCCDALIIL